MSNTQAKCLLVRSICAADAVRWRELWQEYLDFYKQALPEAITTCTWERLLDNSQPLHGNVATAPDGAIVGFVHYHVHLSTWSIAGVCYLEDLYVERRARSVGAGRRLIESVYDAADAAGATRVYWHTERANEAARRLYDRVGVLTDYVQYRRSL